MVEITKIPQTTLYCEGVITLCGKVIPLIDLHKDFEMEFEEWTNNRRIVACKEGETLSA